MSISPDLPGTAISERLGTCEEHDLDLLVVHDTDGTHLGFALNVLRAREDGDDAFAAEIAALISPEEMLRSAVDLVMSAVGGLVAGDCDDEACEHHDTADTAEDGCADAKAVYGYFAALSDFLGAVAGAEEEALLCQDLSETADANTCDALLHAVDVEVALGLASRVLKMVEARYGMTLDEQATEYQRTLPMAA